MMTNKKTTTPKAIKILRMSILTTGFIAGAFALGVSTSGSLQTVGMLGATIPADIVRQVEMVQQEQKTFSIETATELSNILIEGNTPTAKQIKAYDVNNDNKLSKQDIHYILQHLKKHE
jgi:hypothetical protein